MKKRRILLAVTGSIAAYKAVFLLRLLRKAHCDVKILMTQAAKDFVNPLTFSVLSEKPVDSDISSDAEWNNHVESGLWADALIVAPCTANTMAKMASGIADNIVLATYLSARCPVFISPAMDVDMYHHPSTQKNIETLIGFGVHVIPVEYGELASGLVGEGRMAEPEHIRDFVFSALDQNVNNDLGDKRVMITAGPTYEAIDPVRYIGNRSSGKMGIALAKECAQRGAQVDLILGPTHLSCESNGVRVHRVESASEMFQEAKAFFAESDVAIMAAAVADYRPKSAAEQKIKKSVDDELKLELTETNDIAASLGGVKKSNQLLVGFALETNNEMAYAAKKLKKKNFDFIVLNSLQDKGAGFAHDTNKITILRADGTHKAYELKLKTAVATDIVDEIVDRLNK